MRELELENGLLRKSAAKNSADIDFVALMADIELPEDDEEVMGNAE